MSFLCLDAATTSQDRLFGQPNCKPCLCGGNANPARNKESGQCDCSKKFDGLKCDSCTDGYFGHPKCNPCSCGSNSIPATSCNKESGKCDCYVNFKGLRCDSCADGFHEHPHCNGPPGKLYKKVFPMSDVNSNIN